MTPSKGPLTDGLLQAPRRFTVILLTACLVVACSSSSSVKTDHDAAELLIERAQELETQDNLLDALPAHNALLNPRPPERPVMDTPIADDAGIVNEFALNKITRHRQELNGMPGGVKQEPTAEPSVEVALDFADVSLKELLQLLFEEYLHVPYTILDTFEDKQVNFVYQAQATRAELLAVLEAFLGFRGVSMVYSNGVYAITNGLSKLKGQPAELGLGWVAGAFKLRYLTAKDFINIARQFIDVPTNVMELPPNSLFVYARRAQYDAVSMLYERLDVPYFNGKHVIIYSPRFLSVGALKAVIEHYHKMLGAPVKQGSKLFEVEGINELNQLVIVAADDEARDMVVQFLNSTDTAEGNAWQVFQYVLTNQEVVEVLPSVLSLVKAIMKEDGRVQIVADKGSNSLFVAATPEDYAELLKLIKRLDYRPPAVHIDVMLVEVVLTDSMKYGVEWFLFGKPGNNQISAQGDLSANVAKGLILDFVNLKNDKFATLEVLAEETDFSILANPQLVVKTGSTASLVVGQEIAIEKSILETNTAGSSAQTEFERRDVAIQLEATPTIGADQQIQVALKLTDERDIGRDINGQPIFAKREMKTDVVAYDGDTIFIAGIIRERQTEQKSKIPILGDLAYIGPALFSSNDRVEERIELIVLVTPRLLLDDEGANIMTNAIIGAEAVRASAAKTTAEANSGHLDAATADANSGHLDAATAVVP